MNYETNIRLAEQYLSIAATFSHKCTKAIEIIRKKIADADIEIKRVYESNGNLNKLKIKGIGIQTRDFLELILEKGYEETLKSVKEKRGNRLEEQLSFLK